jgi:hypothetical protein
MSGRGASVQNVIDSGARFRDSLNAGGEGRRRNRWRIVWRPHDNMPPIPAADRRVYLEFVPRYLTRLVGTDHASGR